VIINAWTQQSSKLVSLTELLVNGPVVRNMLFWVEAAAKKQTSLASAALLKQLLRGVIFRQSSLQFLLSVGKFRTLLSSVSLFTFVDACDK
jgi:hypothetical protein